MMYNPWTNLEISIALFTGFPCNTFCPFGCKLPLHILLLHLELKWLDYYCMDLDEPLISPSSSDFRANASIDCKIFQLLKQYLPGHFFHQQQPGNYQVPKLIPALSDEQVVLIINLSSRYWFPGQKCQFCFGDSKSHCP